MEGPTARSRLAAALDRIRAEARREGFRVRVAGLTPAHAAGCDLLVLGETHLHTCLEAQASGVALLLPGRFVSSSAARNRLYGDHVDNGASSWFVVHVFTSSGSVSTPSATASSTSLVLIQ